MNRLLSWCRHHWSNVLFFGVVAACVGVFYRGTIGLDRGKYAIGYVTGRTVMPSSGWSVQYRFTVRDTVYFGSAPDENDMNWNNGARYLLKYDSLAPKWHQIFYKAPIPDSIRRAPRNGWSRRPWPDPEHPARGPLPAARPARDSAQAAMWREMDATQTSADSLDARARRAP